MNTSNTTSTTNVGDTARFSRPENVVWRLAPDRVLVRRVGDLSDDGCADLIGFAAAVWVGLDEPASLTELRARLADAGIDTDDGNDTADVHDTHFTNDTNFVEAVAALVERGWIEQIDVEADPQADPQADPAGGAHDR